ncbi:hypothetical protein NDU88_003697 [Pleurodeles waltl]|uniref:Prolactin receptor n=1 Tax=Pleurodeles waltl TaxID=8319 RepID=A0AAV7SGP6_PLEWA|nr:hypothetical protein NDU88_003697 [Pleurodeles waltl]
MTEHDDVIWNPWAGRAGRSETGRRMVEPEECKQENRCGRKTGQLEDEDAKKKMSGGCGGKPKSREPAIEKRESGKACHAEGGTWLLQEENKTPITTNYEIPILPTLEEEAQGVEPTYGVELK